MKSKMLFLAGVAVIASMGSNIAGADPLLFSFSGPSGTAVFRLNSSPTPDFSSAFLSAEQFGFYNIPGTFDGMAGTASTISFGSGFYSSLSITAPNLGFTQFSNPVLFTGLQSAPTFSTGTFTVVNPFFGNGTLTISSISAAVPEPATWGMMIVGLGVIGFAMRRRSKITARVSCAA